MIILILVEENSSGDVKKNTQISELADSPAEGSGYTVAVIDSPFLSLPSAVKDQTISGNCYSREDDIVIEGTRHTTGGVLHDHNLFGEAMSHCHNGADEASGTSFLPGHIHQHRNTSLTHPGFHPTHSTVIEYHGTNVARAVLEKAPAANLHSAVTTFHDPPSCVDNITPNCTSLDVDDVVDNLITVRFIYRLIAVNLSVGAEFIDNQLPFCLDNLGQEEVDDLSALGIAVVSSSGNEGNSEEPKWPACLNGVYSVAAVDDNDYVTDYSNVQDGVNFLAKGKIDIVQGGSDSATSYASPRIAGAIAAMKSAKPSASMATIIAKLKEAGDLAKNKSVSNAPLLNLEAAIFALLNNIQTPMPTPVTPGLTETGQYGFGYGSDQHKYGYAISFSTGSVLNQATTTQSSPPQTTLDNESATCSANDRIALSVTGYDISTNEIGVYVNGTGIGYLSNSGYRQHNGGDHFQISCSLLKTSGTNFIEFRQSNPGQVWGVTNIRVIGNGAPITLIVGLPHTGAYGYGFGTNNHYAKLTALFQKPGNKGVKFTVSAWDIDRTDENSLYLNGEFKGYLNPSPCSSCYSPPTSFVFKKRDLISGTNVIEFRQRVPDDSWSGFQDEKWGVTALDLQEYSLNIEPILQYLQWNREKEPVVEESADDEQLNEEPN